MCIATLRNDKPSGWMMVAGNFMLAAAFLFSHTFSHRIGLSETVGDFCFGLLIGLSIALNLMVIWRRGRGCAS